jgi:2'-5' RNA ligase
VRLFVALNLPEGIRQALWDATVPLRNRGLPVKWVRPDAIHLTLKFLGEVSDASEPELTAALGRAVAGSHPIPLAVGGFGAFPAVDRPRVIWAGLAPDPALELLAHRIEQELAPLGFPPEGRPFQPHVTLGRATRNARPQEFEGLERVLTRLRYDATALVHTVDLMQSVPGPGGSSYQVRHSERLS